MRIGELARAVGLSTHTLRYYEREGLLACRFVRRRENGYRDYSDEAAARIRDIASLAVAGFTLAEIRELLTRWDEGRLTQSDGLALIEKKAAAIDARIAELQRTKRALLEMRRAHGHGRRHEAHAAPAGK